MAKRFSKVIAPFYILASNVRGLQCLHILSSPGYYQSFPLSPSQGKGGDVCCFVCISRVTSDVTYLFAFSLAVYIAFGVKRPIKTHETLMRCVLFKYCPIL
jgi:hypothetical protein